MKTLQSFKKERVALKSVNGGKMNYKSGLSFDYIWSMPGGASTEGNFIASFLTDYDTAHIGF